MSGTKSAFDLSSVSVNDLLDSNQDMGGGGTDDQNVEGATMPPADTSDTDDADQNNDQDDHSDDDQDTDNDQNDNTDTDTSDDSEGSDDGDDSEGNDEPEPTVISEISSLLGYDIEGDFSDDVQGIADLTKQVGAKMGEQYASQIFEQFPDVQEYLQFRAQGGDPDKYFSAVKEENDYSSVTDEQLSKSPELQKRMVSEMYKLMGYDEDSITDTIKDLEDSELLGKQSKMAQTRLKAVSAENKARMFEEQKAADARRKEQEQEEWKQITSTIQAGNVKGITIPENDKKAFFDWMTKPVDDKGRTKRMVDMEQMDTESTVALEYLYYKQFEVSNLKGAKGSNKSQQLRDRLRTAKGSVTKTMNTGKNPGHQRSTALPGLDELL